MDPKMMLERESSRPRPQTLNLQGGKLVRMHLGLYRRISKVSVCRNYAMGKSGDLMYVAVFWGYSAS